LWHSVSRFLALMLNLVCLAVLGVWRTLPFVCSPFAACSRRGRSERLGVKLLFSILITVLTRVIFNDRRHI
jgi:hypothetical protein